MASDNPSIVHFTDSIGGNTGLILTCAMGNFEIAKFLLQKGANPNTQATKSGDTALHKAVLIQRKDLVDLLLSNGANINLKNKKQCPPLANAVRMSTTIADRSQIVCYLVQRGAIVNDSWFETGYTPLMSCIDYAHDLETIEYIVENNANLKTKSNKGFTALMLACRWGYLTFVKFLLEQDYSQINLTDISGWTPLMYALRWGSLNENGTLRNQEEKQRKSALVRFLIENKADIKFFSQDDYSPLFLVTRYGPGDVFHLIAAATDINARTKNGDTVLHYAAKYAPLRALTELLTYKLDVNARNNKDETPLMIIARSGAMAETKFLLEKGAKKDLKNKDKKTAFDLAKSSNQSKEYLALLK